MASTRGNKAYRCSGRTRGFVEFERQSLWLGPGELLSVTTVWGRESNRTFPFADIESITIQGTAFGRFLNIVFLAGALAGLGLGALYYAREGAENASLGIVGFAAGGLALVALLANVALGRTCVSHLYTAVHVEELKPLRRWRRARRFVRNVVPAISAVQGSLTPDLAARIQQSPGAVQLAAHGRAREDRRRPSLQAHRILVLMLVVAGGVMVPNALLFFPGKISLDFFLFGAVILCAAVAGVQQVRLSLTRSIRLLPWAAFILAGIGALIAFYATSVRGIGADAAEQPFALSDIHRMISAMLGFVMLAVGAAGWGEVVQFDQKTRNEADADASEMPSTDAL